jgi:hypothetical protein
MLSHLPHPFENLTKHPTLSRRRNFQHEEIGMFLLVNMDIILPIEKLLKCWLLARRYTVRTKSIVHRMFSDCVNASLEIYTLTEYMPLPRYPRFRAVSIRRNLRCGGIFASFTASFNRSKVMGIRRRPFVAPPS